MASSTESDAVEGRDEALRAPRRRRSRCAACRRGSRAGSRRGTRRSRPRSAGSRASAARGSPNATTAVIRPAANSGTPKSRFSAIAAPTNSARSVDMAISSACTQSPRLALRGKCSRHSSGRLLARRDADLRREVLDQHRHQVRRDDHPQQQVAVLGAAGDVRREVAGVDVRDAGDERRAQQRQDRAQPAARAHALQRARRRKGEFAGGRRRVHSSTLIARASDPPSTWTSPAEAREDRPVERLLLDDLEVVARGDAARGEVAQHLRVGVGDPHEAAAVAGAERLQADRRLVGHRARRASGSGRRAGRASGCRASPRSAPRAPRTARARAPRPRRARGPTARRATRSGSARAGGGGGSPRARSRRPWRVSCTPLYGRVRDQAEPVELLDHRRRRRRRDAAGARRARWW